MTRQRPYDNQNIEAIRRDLLAYKATSTHGAPYIATLISEANKNRPIINQRRLSRFLARVVREPEAAFLGWCETFLKTLPVPPDPVFRLAQGLQSFCKPVPGYDYTGHYHLTVVTLANKAPNPYASSEISFIPDDGFWRVEERFIARHKVCNGALIHTSAFGMMITMDMLTQIPQLCTLVIEDERLVGYTLSANQERASARYGFILEKSDGQ